MATKKLTQMPIDLMSRTDGGIETKLWYHGAEATPKLTVEVIDTTGNGDYFVLEPSDENCMDMYYHPHSYRCVVKAA